MRCVFCLSRVMVRYHLRKALRPELSGWRNYCPKCHNRFTDQEAIQQITNFKADELRIYFMPTGNPYFDIFESLMKFGTILMEKLPNYSQRKRNQFHDLITQYRYEKTMNPNHRDDQKIDELRDRIEMFLSAFSVDLDEHLEFEKTSEKTKK